MKEMLTAVVSICWAREEELFPKLQRITWRGVQSEPHRDNRDLYISLHRGLDSGPVGWIVQLGSANRLREVSLVEVAALLPAETVEGDLLCQIVDAHFELIDAATRWILDTIASDVVERSKRERAATLLHDVIRLRHEAKDARFVGDVALEHSIEERLAQAVG